MTKHRYSPLNSMSDIYGTQNYIQTNTTVLAVFLKCSEAVLFLEIGNQLSSKSSVNQPNGYQCDSKQSTHTQQKLAER